MPSTFGQLRSAAGDVERYGDQIAHLQHFYVVALFCDDLSGKSRAQNQTLRGGCAASHHVLIGSRKFWSSRIVRITRAERLFLPKGRVPLGHPQLRVGMDERHLHTVVLIYATPRLLP